MTKQISLILYDMSKFLSDAQLTYLQDVLAEHLEHAPCCIQIDNSDILASFLESKQIEGCSQRTISYYRSTIAKMLKTLDLPIDRITTKILREYLSDYYENHSCSKVTIDNTRRTLSSFFAWLEDEDYISKNPVKRIHKIKTGIQVKEILSDENIEILRDGVKNIRDLAIIDLLYSTGIRVGELIRLDKRDIDFEERECIVYGKGDKERRVYFDARAKLHLQDYLDHRTDDNPALFVSLYVPHNRLGVSGVEVMLKRLGNSYQIPKVHPHKFRRSMASRAIDKGMPVEQVQKILGHQQIDTTMIYAMVNQSNVKSSHRKILS